MNAPIKSQLDIAALQSRQGAHWIRLPLVLALSAALALVAIYWQTAASIVAIWLSSDTFVHGFVVVPICLWLVWQRRAELSTQVATPWWPGLVFAFAAGALWLVMSVANVNGVRQFALAFMIQAAIVTVVGKRLARDLFFPLAFLLFAIPAGEILIPTLIDWTANFTVSALRASGVPVYREGNHFIIPSGAWSVVEACSGVRYLIASTMVGVIYAAIAYRSARRRLLFIAASIVVPIVANWLRAYLIVMIGHLSNNKYAVGVDHLIYGWGFFGFVILLLFWAGSWWREDAASVSGPRDEIALPVRDAQSAPSALLIAAAVLSVAAAGVWRPLEAFIEQPQAAGIPVLASLAGTQDWRPVAPFVGWKPRYQGYAVELQQAFRSNDDKVVGLYIAYYVQQEKGKELVTSGNLLVARDDWNWKQVAQSTEVVAWSGRPTKVERVALVGVTGQLELLQLFWVDGQVTDSPYKAKALMAWAKLSGRGDDSALIVAFTPATRNTQEPLRDFIVAMSPAIEGALASVRISTRVEMEAQPRSDGGTPSPAIRQPSAATTTRNPRQNADGGN